MYSASEIKNLYKEYKSLNSQNQKSDWTWSDIEFLCSDLSWISFLFRKEGAIVQFLNFILIFEKNRKSYEILPSKVLFQNIVQVHKEKREKDASFEDCSRILMTYVKKEKGFFNHEFIDAILKYDAIHFLEQAHKIDDKDIFKYLLGPDALSEKVLYTDCQSTSFYRSVYWILALLERYLPYYEEGAIRKLSDADVQEQFQLLNDVANLTMKKYKEYQKSEKMKKVFEALNSFRTTAKNNKLGLSDQSLKIIEDFCESFQPAPRREGRKFYPLKTAKH